MPRCGPGLIFATEVLLLAETARLMTVRYECIHIKG